MDWSFLIELCLIPLLAFGVKLLKDFVVAKKEELKAKTDSEVARKYYDMIAETVVDCVDATHQTYVKTLKEENAFTKEKQKEALEKTYQDVLSILNDDAKEYLKEAKGDAETYIKNKIEATIKQSK